MSAPASVVCVIPGLIWPTTGLAGMLAPLDLPGLSALLANATESHAAPRALDNWLAGQFGLQENVPFAALRHAGERASAPDTGTLWVCADPVSLRFARQHLLLDGPDTLSLQPEEASLLLTDLNVTFADIGHFTSTSAAHFYLALRPAHHDKLDVTLAPLADVESRPVAQFQAQGPHATWWSKLSNELQVFCHNHPVNTAREARGAPPLNALWLWGAGRTPRILTPPYPHMSAQLERPYALLEGLARLADVKIVQFNVRQPTAWALLDTLYRPAQQRDAKAWASALASLDETIFQPLSRQLRAGSIARLRVEVPGDTSLTRFDLSPTPRWKFWQGGASKARLSAMLGKPAA